MYTFTWNYTYIRNSRVSKYSKCSKQQVSLQETSHRDKNLNIQGYDTGLGLILTKWKDSKLLYPQRMKWQKHWNLKMVGIFSKQFLSHHFVATTLFKNGYSIFFFQFSSSIHNRENLNMSENMKFPEARALLGKAEIMVQGVPICNSINMNCHQRPQQAQSFSKRASGDHASIICFWDFMTLLLN